MTLDVAIQIAVPKLLVSEESTKLWCCGQFDFFGFVEETNLATLGISGCLLRAVYLV